jgi:hypothetical protein
VWRCGGHLGRLVVAVLVVQRDVSGVQDLLPMLLIWGDCYLPRCDRVDLRTSVSGQVIRAVYIQMGISPANRWTFRVAALKQTRRRVVTSDSPCVVGIERGLFWCDTLA